MLFSSLIKQANKFSATEGYLNFFCSNYRLSHHHPMNHFGPLMQSSRSAVPVLQAMWVTEHRTAHHSSLHWHKKFSLSVYITLHYSYSTWSGNYGSKQTESKGVAWRRGLFTIAINLTTCVVLVYPTRLVVCCYYLYRYIPPDWSFVVITVNTSVHVQVFTVTLILFAHNCV